MKKINPVYKIGKKISVRDARTAGIVFSLNALLTIAAIVQIYVIVRTAKYGEITSQQSVLYIYQIIACIEFLMILCVVPLMTSCTITGERERQTLDLLLCSKMSSKEIIAGKLLAFFRIECIVILSGVPVFLPVFLYGEISGTDLILLFIYYVFTALFIGSLGILMSSLFRKTFAAAGTAYLVMVILNVGTMAAVYMCNRVSYVIYSRNTEHKLFLFAGKAVYLLLLNPLASFWCYLTDRTEDSCIIYEMLEGMEQNGGRFLLNHWVGSSIIIQAALMILFLYGASKLIEPRRRAV